MAHPCRHFDDRTSVWGRLRDMRPDDLTLLKDYQCKESHRKNASLRCEEGLQVLSGFGETV